MDDDGFFEYLQKLIMKLYPDASPTKGRWVVIKCDSGPGRLNSTLLVHLRYHRFILYPSIPHTTAVTQKMDQSYGLFQSAVRISLELVIEERIHAEKPMNLLLWIVGLVVFGDKDPETGLIVESAFQKGFSHAQNIHVWVKVGAMPLSRNCLQSPKIRRLMSNGDNDQQALVYMIVEHNVIACNTLSMEDYNGDMMKITLKAVKCTNNITATPHARSNQIVESSKDSQQYLCCSRWRSSDGKQNL